MHETISSGARNYHELFKNITIYPKSFFMFFFFRKDPLSNKSNLYQSYELHVSFYEETTIRRYISNACFVINKGTYLLLYLCH